MNPFQKIKTIIRSHPVLSMTASVVFFLGFQAIFTFCGSKSCPGFVDDSFDTWFPYKNSNDLYFTDGNKTDTLKLSYKNRTEPYKTSGGFESKPCGAYAQYDWYSLKTNTPVFNLYANVSNSTPSYSLTVKGVELNFKVNGDNSFSFYSPVIRSSPLQTISLGARTLNLVQEFIVDTIALKGAQISSFYIAHNQGLVAYREITTGTLWVKE